MHVLLVEDDPQLGEFLQRILAEETISSRWVRTLAEAHRELTSPDVDVVVLDWMLPDGDGTDLCERLGAFPAPPPVLMLTARGELADRVHGLRSGADDYLTKPFEVEELLARLDALARRARGHRRTRFGELELNPLLQRATLRGVSLELTSKEFALLARLVQEDERPVERAALLLDVWGLRFDPGTGVLDVHISRLRDKLGEESWRIETVRGVGYRLRRSR